MSRRDTIIVAVLVNTGLLAALFMMAMHTDTQLAAPKDASLVEVILPEPAPLQVKPEPPTPSVDTAIASRDEIDEVLKNYTMNTPKPAIVTPEKIPPGRTATQPVKEEVRHDQKYAEVTVKRGDYLEKIARANGTTVSAVMQANGLSTPRIDVGQVLLIPIKSPDEKQAQPIQSGSPSKESLRAEPQYYTMKSGDNPWKIAKEHHVKFDDLLQMNDLDEGKARNLKPGDVLRVK